MLRQVSVWRGKDGGKGVPAKTNPYRNWIARTMNGVKNANRKFHSQFDAVDIAPCLARVRMGKVSPMMIQTPGAQVVAYPRMNMQAEMIITMTDVSSVWHNDEGNALTLSDTLVFRRVFCSASSAEHEEPETTPYTTDDEWPASSKLLTE